MTLSIAYHSRRTAIAASLLIASAVSRAALGTLQYSVQVISPVDTASTNRYTTNGALEFSTLTGSNAAGQIIGTSNIYNGGSTSLGTDAWLYSPTMATAGGLTLLGLTGTRYTNASGVQNSSPTSINAAGELAGTSTVYTSGGLTSGFDAWFYNPTVSATPVVIDPTTLNTQGTYSYSFVSTNAQASQNSVINGLTDTGFTAGNTSLYAGTSNVGQATWLYKPAAGSVPATLTQVGLTPLALSVTGGKNYTTSQINGINAAGLVVGSSVRYLSGTANLGRDAWYYDSNTANSTTVSIGLTGSASDTNPNYQFSAAIASTTYANVFYSWTNSSGNTTFFSNAVAGVSPGNSPVNSHGLIAGIAARYTSTGSTLSNDAWVYNKSTGTTTIIGLNGPGYDLSNKSHTNAVVSVSDAGSVGIVVGTTLRWGPSSTALGVDSWLYNANTGATTVLSLSGGVYDSTAAAGYHNTTVVLTNSLGMASGFATRYSGSSSVGQDAWIYDPNANSGAGKIFTISPSVSSDGYHAFSSVQYLSDTGIALGLYSVYSGTTKVSQDAFMWKENADGTATTTDLDLQITNLASYNWQSLYSSLRITSPSGTIYGYGTRLSAPGNIVQGTSQEIFAANIAGDVDGDGRITIDDYLAIDRGYAGALTGYANGDFNRDGTINAADYALIDYNYREQSGTLADGEISLHTAEFGAAYSTLLAVPEPATIGFLAAGAYALVALKKHRQRS